MATDPLNVPPIQLSVLDRLLDDSPGSEREAPKRHAETLREMRAAVRRDIENLLNSRWSLFAPPGQYGELEKSLANFGVPDFTASYLRAVEDPAILCRIIERALFLFEPRLRNVRVEPIRNESDRVQRIFRFRIEAILRVDPIENRVTFDTSLEPTSGKLILES